MVLGCTLTVRPTCVLNKEGKAKFTPESNCGGVSLFLYSKAKGFAKQHWVVG